VSVLKISIVTAVYNNDDTILDCINSILFQTYKNIEFIIIDGSSTDGTVDIVKGYGDKIDKFISEPDNGIYDAMNKGLELATGDIVGILNSDDFYKDEYVVEKVVKKFRTGSLDILYSDLVYVNDEDTNKVIRYWNAGEYKKKKLKFGWMPPHPTFFVKKELYDELGTFNTEYSISADYDLMMRFLCRDELKIGYLSEVTVNMRVGGKSNKSLENIIRKMKEDYKVIRANKIGGFYTLLLKNLSKIPQFLRKKGK